MFEIGVVLRASQSLAARGLAISLSPWSELTSCFLKMFVFYYTDELTASPNTAKTNSGSCNL